MVFGEKRKEREKKMTRKVSKLSPLSPVTMGVALLMLLLAVVCCVRAVAPVVDEETYWPRMAEDELEKLEIVSSKLDDDQKNAIRDLGATTDLGKAVPTPTTTNTTDPPQKWPQWLVERLKKTNPLNLDEIVSDLQIDWKWFPEKPLRFGLGNPYWPPHHIEDYPWRASKRVLRWYLTYEQNASVCAIKWADDKKVDYYLRTFPSKESLPEGWIVTHDKGCGACSTLQDLSIYLGMADLTAPVRTCTKKFGLVPVRDCLEQSVKLTPLCSEAWAYDGSNTKLFCTLTCIEDYGLENIIIGRYPPDNMPDGSLHPCIECDEDKSGAGFKYGAGRTRRNSGIVSSIKRDPGEISHIDHFLYFKDDHSHDQQAKK